ISQIAVDEPRYTPAELRSVSRHEAISKMRVDESRYPGIGPCLLPPGMRQFQREEWMTPVLRNRPLACLRT
ncbi:MAG: hypothetical protein LUE27_07830, partial [Clostridia bacterium]|nr:hypothetical protein [Clostridia bacterium]